MKQAILYGAGDLRLEERPLSLTALGDDRIAIKTEVTAFSTGTDLGNGLLVMVFNAGDSPAGHTLAIRAARGAVTEYGTGARADDPHAIRVTVPPHDVRALLAEGG
jgi:hypothetical protein